MVIRYAVDEVGGGVNPLLSDVIGRVLSVDETAVTVERRDGTAVTIEQHRIAIAKPVPLAPLRTRSAHRISAANLMRISSRGWPPTDAEQLGEWQLRAAGGFTRRANSVAAVGDPGCSMDEALEVVTDFYRAHNLPPLAQVIAGSHEEQAFRAARWSDSEDRSANATVQVAPLGSSSRDEHDAGVRTDDRASEAWIAMYQRAGQDDVDARAVLEGPATVAFLSIGDPLAAIGRIVVTGEWAGINCLEVANSSRREGLARRILESGFAWARARGADKVYTQVTPDNAAAIALYASYGFTDHHSYCYLAPRGAED